MNIIFVSGVDKGVPSAVNVGFNIRGDVLKFLAGIYISFNAKLSIGCAFNIAGITDDLDSSRWIGVPVVYCRVTVKYASKLLYCQSFIT